MRTWRIISKNYFNYLAKNVKEPRLRMAALSKIESTIIADLPSFLMMIDCSRTLINKILQINIAK
jgi:hypothetical protein